MQNMEYFLKLLEPFFNNEDLAGQTLICVSKISFAALEDNPNAIPLYQQYFYSTLKQALEQASNLDKIIDYELMEGSLNMIYHFVNIFKNQAK